MSKILGSQVKGDLSNSTLCTTLTNTSVNRVPTGLEMVSRQMLREGREVLPGIEGYADTATVASINENSSLNEQRVRILETIVSGEFNPQSIPLLVANSDLRLLERLMSGIIRRRGSGSEEDFAQVPNIFLIGSVGLDITSFGDLVGDEIFNHLSQVDRPLSVINEPSEATSRLSTLTRVLLRSVVGNPVASIGYLFITSATSIYFMGYFNPTPWLSLAFRGDRLDYRVTPPEVSGSLDLFTVLRNFFRFSHRGW